jgi:hypothetical protein
MGIIKLDRLNMTAQKVTLPMGLVVEEITLKTESAGYDSRKNTLDMSKPGVVRARVTADDLANFLAGEFPAPLRDPKVELIPGFVLVSATAKVLIEITATAKCLLEVRNRSELHVVLVEVDKGGPVQGLVEGQLDRINPVIKAEDFPIPVNLDTVEIGLDGIVLTGTFSGSEF